MRSCHGYNEECISQVIATKKTAGCLLEEPYVILKILFTFMVGYYSFRTVDMVEFGLRCWNREGFFFGLCAFSVCVCLVLLVIKYNCTQQFQFWKGVKEVKQA